MPNYGPVAGTNSVCIGASNMDAILSQLSCDAPAGCGVFGGIPIPNVSMAYGRVKLVDQDTFVYSFEINGNIFAAENLETQSDGCLTFNVMFEHPGSSITIKLLARRSHGGPVGYYTVNTSDIAEVSASTSC